MAEYIEREAVKEAIGFINLHFVACGENKSLLDGINEIPAADVVPVVHGRWIDGADSFGAKRGAFRVCSRCNICFPRDDAIVPPWFWQGCPNCFARMDGDG